MKKFIKLISIFTLVFLSSMSVYAAESTSLSMEDLDTVMYEELLTEFYGVEEGYAYCSVAVNITSDTALTDTVTIGIPDAVGTNVWRVSTELTEDSNVSAVQYNNSYYYLYPVLNPVFTDEGVSFQTDKLGIFIAGGCLDDETLESFSSGASLFAIDNGTYTFDGTTYNLADGTLLDNDYATGYLFSDGRLIVTAFKKKDDASSSSYPWDASKRSIKKISFTDNVTFIGDFAFFAYKDIIGDLVIPDSVTSIGRHAFVDCSGFTGALTLGNRLQTIDNWAFEGCSGFTGDLVIPDSVTSIGLYAFTECSGFNGTLKLSNNLSTIENGTFSSCSGLTGTLTLPTTVTSIGDRAFWKCSGFTGDLTIPNSVTSIGMCAFYSCSGFTSLTISNKISTISESVFYGCSGFTGDLIIPDSVTTIDAEAFKNCSGFTGDLIIPNSIITIGDGAFEYCSGFNGILNLPDSITTICNRTFFSCSGLTGSLVIPNTVTSIGDYAFWDCSGLTGSLVIPDSVTFIGEAAFQSCEGFTGNLTLPNSITEIQEYTFSGCSGFTGNLVIPSTVTSIGKSAFSYCSAFTGDLVIPYSVTTIGGGAFYRCSGFTGNLIIPDNVTTIDAAKDDIVRGAFENCSGFDGTLTLPNALVTIDEGTFKGCVGLKGSLNIPDSVTTINNKAFYNCPNIVRFEYGNNVTTLGTNVFYTASETPTELITSNGLLINYDWATDNRAILKEYTLNTAGDLKGLLNTNKGVLTVSGSGTDLDLTLATVLGDDVSIIKSLVFEAENVESICDSWCKDTSVSGALTLPESLVSIGNEAFYGLHSVNKITVGGTVTSIGTNAFYVDSVEKIATALRSSNTVATQYNWDGDNRFVCEYILNTAGDLFGSLDSNGILDITGTGTVLDIPLYTALDDKATQVKGIEFQTTNLTVIGDNWCKDLKNIEGALNIPSGVVTIGAYAFYKCGFTGGLVIPNSVTSVGEYAFYYCSGFTGDLVIPDSVTSIGESAFDTCSFDGILTLGSGLKIIGASAFESCNFTGDLILPDGLNNIGSQAFMGCTDFNGNLTIPDSVTTIGDYAFAHCIKLRGKLIIPAGLTKISSGVFSNCFCLSGQLVIPDKITEIGNDAFNNCINIRDIKIGTYKKILKWYKDNSKLTSIGENAFYSDYKILTSLDTKNSTAEGYDWAGSNRLLSVSTYTTYLNTAQDLTGTLNLSTGELVISGTGTNLDKPLMECIGLLPLSTFTWQTDTIETICDSWCSNAMYYYYQVEELNMYPNLSGSLVLPNSIKSIGSEAFLGCKGFTGKLSLPNSLESIGSTAFMGCEGLTGDLTIPDTVTSLGVHSFDFCSGLNGTLTIPDSVTDIGGAFAGCNNITSIVIGSGVESISDMSFACTIPFKDMMNSGNDDSPFVTTPVDTVVTTSNKNVIAYDWAADMRNTTFIVDVPLNTTGDLMGHIDTSIGELSITGDGKDLDIPLSDVFDKTILGSIKTLNFEADNIETICDFWCINPMNSNVAEDCLIPNLSGTLNLPNTIKSIGKLAFGNCSGFTGDLVLPNNLKTIGKLAFANCSGFTGKIVIPDSVTTILDQAFLGCNNVAFIEIGNGVDSIGVQAFACANLDPESEEGFVLVETPVPTRLKTRNEVALNYDWSSDMREVTYVIQKYTLNKAEDLFGYLDTETGELSIEGTGVNLDKQLATVLSTTEERAALKSIVFETQTVETIRDQWCDNYYGTFPNLHGALIFPSNLKTIGHRAFRECSGFTGELVIPEGVDSIGLEAFSKCSGFTGNLIIPNSVTSIGDYAFEYCSGFNGTLTLSNQLTELGNGTFRYCSGFTGDLVIPQGVTTLGERTDSSWSYGTFFGCTGFNGLLSLPSSLTSIGDRVFYDCSNLTGTLSIPESITTIGNSSFYNCGKLTGSLIIPDSVTYIGNNAFDHCSGFNGNLILPKNIDIIRMSTFRDCNKLTGSINIPSTVTEIESGAFNRCSSFTGDLVIPNSVVKIGSDSFNGCRSLKGTLTLSENLTVIESGAFGSDGSGRGFFSGTLYIPDSVVTISDKAFCYSEFNTIILGNNITDIGIEAFDWCTNLDKIYIGSNIQNIGTNCFYSPYVTQTKLYTKNQTVLDYDWAGDNRTVVPMNTFTITLPEDITLKPKYIANSDAPVWYASFNMEVTGDFENGSYGVYEKLSSFTIKTEDGKTRTVTTNIEDATVNENGTITVPVELTAPDPNLLEEFTGELKLNTVLHEMIPFAA